MCIVYVGGALWILLAHAADVPAAVKLIFYHAFHPTPSTIRGGVAGVAVMETVRYGVARGVFSNESGLGSAPMAHAAAKTDQPVREGLVAMVGPLIDTIIICSMTALVIVLSGKWDAAGADGKALSGLVGRAGRDYFARAEGSQRPR